MSECRDCIKYNTCNQPFRGILEPAEKCNFFVNENVVTVVRCLKCKYYNSRVKTTLTVGGEKMQAGLCARSGNFIMLPTDFCSYGERSRK